MSALIIFILSFFNFYFELIAPAYGLDKNDVILFLENKTPQEVQEKFLKAVNANVKASSWIVEHEGVVFSLCAVPVQSDKMQSMQNALNSSGMRRASLKAATDLAIYLDNGSTNTKRFENRDAVNHVIRVTYEGKVKFMSSSKVINGTAFALVWSKLVRLSLSEQEFNNDYCSFLYEQAQDLFDAGKFSEALKNFHQIHYMSWANISAYLGASACFLQMKQNDDAARLTSELINTLSADMSPVETASAGRILFNAGRKDEGFIIMERAYQMLSENLK